jgi:hypothetical protein
MSSMLVAGDRLDLLITANKNSNKYTGEVLPSIKLHDVRGRMEDPELFLS